MDAKSLKLVDDACKLASAMINIPMMEFKSITIGNAVEFEADLQVTLIAYTQVKGEEKTTYDIGMIACWLIGYYRAEQLAMVNSLLEVPKEVIQKERFTDSAEIIATGELPKRYEAVERTKLQSLLDVPECKCPCHYGGMDAEGLVKQPCNLCTCDMDNDPIAQQATAAYNRVTKQCEDEMRGKTEEPLSDPFLDGIMNKE